MAGLKFSRHFTTENQNVMESVKWKKVDAVIKSPDGKIVFEQKGVEFPEQWSQQAINITSEKYFRGEIGTVGRECSLRQLVSRLVYTMTNWGVDQGYFDTKVASIFQAELIWLVLNQRIAWNSPVFFNLGFDEKPATSACFIQSVDDSVDGIMDLAQRETRLFKYGSGTGTNFSSLRSSKEPVKGGGKASGPISFMRGLDAMAAAIKSGGRIRRSAKLACLDVNHPDIMEFIQCKVEEEKKARALMEAGWRGEMGGGAYESVGFQNTNNSVRVSDEFMLAVLNNEDWETKFVKSGEVCEKIPARKIFRAIAEASHFCGDPGLQFDTTINEWNTLAVSGKIRASNPCSEHMSLDNTACNLASINLLKYKKHDGVFDVAGFKHTVRLLITSQDILINKSGFPTPQIEENAQNYRQLGLGYANLGSLLMAYGFPYDSVPGRNLAASITSLMTATAYWQSAVMADVLGPFKWFKKNRRPFMKVIRKHIQESSRLMAQMAANLPTPRFKDIGDLVLEADKAWHDAEVKLLQEGARNSQMSCLAPTGTIGFIMDCATTGIEPEMSLVKFKKLVGGGEIKIVNTTIRQALSGVGYSAGDMDSIEKYIYEKGMVEGCPLVKQEHLAIFDCALRPVGGTRSISPSGHIDMMAAVQPFLSAAISKTINCSSDATVEEVEKIYMESWEKGLKSVTIYRDGSKILQPLNQKGSSQARVKPKREHLPEERKAICHKFSVAGNEGYVHVGEYEDGRPGEVFIRMAKEGSTVAGIMDSLATSISIGLQHGIEIQSYISKFKHMRFEPSGFTTNEHIKIAQSIVDYLARWLELKFSNQVDDKKKEEVDSMVIGPVCPECGNMTIRKGTCFTCSVCGSSTGCSG